LGAVDDIRAALRRAGDDLQTLPASVPKPAYAGFSTSIIEDRLTNAFRVASDRLHPTSRLVEIANTSGDWMTSPLVGEMERRVASYLDELRRVPIVQPDGDDDVEAAA
jgi:hypothetical protein